jgi:hypothetical protein
MFLLCKLLFAVVVVWLFISLAGDPDGASRRLSFRIDLIYQGGGFSFQLARVHEALPR